MVLTEEEKKKLDSAIENEEKCLAALKEFKLSLGMKTEAEIEKDREETGDTKEPLEEESQAMEEEEGQEQKEE